MKEQQEFADLVVWAFAALAEYPHQDLTPGGTTECSRGSETASSTSLAPSPCTPIITSMSTHSSSSISKEQYLKASAEDKTRAANDDVEMDATMAMANSIVAGEEVQSNSCMDSNEDTSGESD